jgi:hypothetical protein
MFRYLAAAFILLATASQPSAIERYKTLRQQARSAHQAHNQAAYLRALLPLQEFLHHTPAYVEATAEAYAAVGDTSHALASLNEFAALGQTDEALLNNQSPAFAQLQKTPEYKSILKHLAANNAPAAHAETAFTLADPGIVAEDIAYDPQSKSFFITSILKKKIIRLTLGGGATDFAQSPSQWPMQAIKIDPARNLLWATEVALDTFTAAPKSDWGRSALLCFNLQSGALLRRIEGPAHAALGDMALTPDGTPIVSDGAGGGIYQLAGDTLKLINGADFISPQTPATLPGSQHIFVPDYLRGIGSLDLKSGQVTWLHSDGKYALSGVDGLYFANGSLFLTQNGTSPERVLRLQLDKTYTKIVMEETIERATPTLGDPTHGVIVDGFLYYIANSGWSELDDHGDVKPGSHLTPAHIMRFALKSPSVATPPQQ